VDSSQGLGVVAPSDFTSGTQNIFQEESSLGRIKVLPLRAKISPRTIIIAERTEMYPDGR